MQTEPKVFALVMTLVSGARSAGQRERCGQKNCKTSARGVADASSITVERLPRLVVGFEFSNPKIFKKDSTRSVLFFHLETLACLGDLKTYKLDCVACTAQHHHICHSVERQNVEMRYGWKFFETPQEQISTKKKFAADGVFPLTGVAFPAMPFPQTSSSAPREHARYRVRRARSGSSRLLCERTIRAIIITF